VLLQKENMISGQSSRSDRIAILDGTFSIKIVVLWSNTVVIFILGS